MPVIGLVLDVQGGRRPRGYLANRCHQPASSFHLPLIRANGMELSETGRCRIQGRERNAVRSHCSADSLDGEDALRTSAFLESLLFAS